MGKFTYWASGEAVQADFTNEETLSTEDAQVIATMQVAKELENVASTLKDLMYLLQNQSIPVSIETDKAEG